MADAEPPASNPPAKAAEVDLGGLDAGELLARGLQTVKPSVGASAWEPPTPEELGRLLPGYRIESLLGRGGMGAVYKGVQLNLERPVAIKLLPAEIATDAEFVTRFKREARTLARLQHSRIVTIHDFGQTTAGHLFFVMEYIDGTDLRRILKGPGLDPEQALAVVGQLCDALQAAHREGIVHRDIKPENVLVTRDGYVKLADFGLSRPPQDEDSPQLTETNMVMGTANYMAPEQQDSAVKADHRSDIFALGVMFYEMLTGHTPRGVFDPPSRKLQIDVRIDEVVLKALQSEPERRYQQVSEMKTDVDRIRSTPLPARAPAKPGAKAPKGPAKTPARMRSQMAMVAAAICVPLLGLAGWFLWHTGGHPFSVQNSPIKATKGAPFVNSLGMKFVPVSGTDVLFSIWDTRVQDYAEYARSNGDTVDAAWQLQTFENAPVSRDPDYPVCGVSWTDANAFCQWLTRKESAAGKLPKGMVYRLPTDLEWSAAAGLPHEDGETPKERSIAGQSQYPWGGGFPPANKTGNFADETMKAAFPSRQNFIRGYTDGFATTSPVGSFPANSFGLYDMGGNVWQWCEDRFDPEKDERVLRGSHFGDSGGLFASNRTGWGPGSRNVSGGFRCVLAMREPDRKSAAAPVAGAKTAPSSPPGIPLFNGHDLKGWRTVGYAWSVQDGALVCQPSDQGAPLVWEDGKVSDFELNCKYRSNRIFDKKYWYGAIRFRDQITNATTLGMTGPSAQVELNLGGTGNIVEAGGRELLAFRGERSFLVNGGVSRSAAVYVPGTLSGFGKAVASYQANDWNDFRIVAVGKHIQIFLNGSLMTESVDATSVAAKEGVLALANGPLQFKDIFLKEIKGAPPVDLSLPLPLELPAKAGGVKLRYVQQGSMAPKKVGTRDFANVEASTDDPNAVLDAKPVYFDQQTGHQVYYEVESSKPLTEIYFTGVGFYDFRIEILDHQSGVTTSSGPYNGGNTRRTIRMPLPNLTRFQIALRSHAGSWLLVEDLHFGAASNGGTAVGTNPTPASPAPAQSVTATAATATKDHPFEDTLGMKFVPVPGTKVLFSIWDTRVADYAAYAAANPKVDGGWKTQSFIGVPVSREPEYPVTGVSWDDAQAFCAWLTEKERAESKLPIGAKYRLPTDEEWSRAVGLPPEQGATPAEKGEKNSVDFPWGKEWPPKGKVGNYADEAYHAKFPLIENGMETHSIEGYADGYATTSPVGSFPANGYGLYDMGGNLWQWCEDWLDASHTERVRRGASWNSNGRGYLLSSNRNHNTPTTRIPHNGFRCVLEPVPSSPLGSATADKVWAMSVGLHTPTPLPTPVATPAPVSAPTAEKDALERALMSRAWTWKPIGSAGYSWTEVVFWRDGTMTTSTSTNARWTVTGPHSVALQFNTGDRLNLTFHFGFDYFTGAGTDGHDLVNGWMKPAGAVPATASTLIPSGPEPATTERALLGTKWHVGNWKTQFQAGHIINVDEGTPQVRLWHWWVMGPRQVHVQYAAEPANFDASRGTDFIIDEAFTKFFGQGKNSDVTWTRDLSTAPGQPAPPGSPAPVSAAPHPAYSTGFEAPQFKVGKFEGQDSHWSILAGSNGSDTPNAVRIVSNVRQSGNQAVLISAAPSNKIQTGISTKYENSAKVVRFHADFYLRRSLHQTPWQFAICDESASGGFVGGFNIARDDSHGQLITRGLPAMGPIVSREQWHHLEVVCDVNKQAFTIVLDGVVNARDVPFLTRVSQVRVFQCDTFSNGDDSAYFDNFALMAEP